MCLNCQRFNKIPRSLVQFSRGVPPYHTTRIENVQSSWPYIWSIFTNSLKSLCFYSEKLNGFKPSKYRSQPSIFVLKCPEARYIFADLPPIPHDTKRKCLDVRRHFLVLLYQDSLKTQLFWSVLRLFWN